MLGRAIVVGLTVASLLGTVSCAGENLGGPAGGGPGVGFGHADEIVLSRTLAKEALPLQISVEGDDREGIKQAQLYQLLNGNKQWIGETPQDVILSPGLNRLVLGFFGTAGDGEEPDKLGVDVILDGGRARVDALNYYIDSSKLTEPPSNNRPPPIRTSRLEEKLDYLHAGAAQGDRARERARLEFISSLRKRSSFLGTISEGEWPAGA